VTFLIVILSVALLALVVFVLSAPVRAARGPIEHPGEDGLQQSEAERARAVSISTSEGDLEAAREAKYREIRDSELDYRTGKLSRSDYESIDSGLRAEAIEILNRLEELRPEGEELGADGEVEPAGEEISRPEVQPGESERGPGDDEEPRGELDVTPMAGKLRPRDA
jgi:hypothetical protein